MLTWDGVVTAVHGKQPVLELELLLGPDRLALAQQIIEELFLEFPRPMGVGVR
jgi:hypothetical protein